MNVLVLSPEPLRSDPLVAARTEALRRQLEKAFPAATVTVCRSGAEPDAAAAGNPPDAGRHRDARASARTRAQQVMALARIGLVRAALYTRGLPRVGPEPRWLPESSRDAFAAIRDAQVVVDADAAPLAIGPGLGGTVDLAVRLLPLAIALRLGKTVIVAPRSFDRPRSTLQRILLTRALAACRLVMVADSISMENLHDVALPIGVLRPECDPLLALEPAPRAERADGARTTVALVVDGPADPARRAWVEHAVSGLRTALVSRRGWQVVEADASAEEQTTAPATRALLASADLVVTDRLTAALVALRAGRPCLVLETDGPDATAHPVRGVMRDLDLHEWVFDPGSVSSHTLLGAVDRLVAQESGYLGRLADTLPAKIHRAERVGEAIAAAAAGRRLPTAPPPRAEAPARAEA